MVAVTARRVALALHSIPLAFAVLAMSGCGDGHHGAGADADEGAQGGSAGSDADSGSDDDDDDGGEGGALDDPEAIGVQGMRRMTLAELDATLQLLLGVDDAALQPLLAVLPGDGSTPFDNDYTIQTPSAPLVEGMFSIAEQLAELVLSDPQLRASALGCTPSGPGDAGCLRGFAERFGRLALRRPLGADELDELAGLISHGEAANDFDVAAAMVLQAIVLDGEFLYRIERGEPVAGHDDLVRLGDHEIATRLAFLLWGSGPDAALLDRAAAGELVSGDDIREVARALVQDRRGLAQLQRMHAMWLGYQDMGLEPTLAASLRAETDKLLERALVEGDWLGIFTADDTWIDPTLAAHYDIALPGGEPGWAPYPDIRRRGLLSHGSFLSTGAKFGDTSPTERGKAVWTRLLCNDIPPPPPEVDSGLPPTGGTSNACKIDRYDMRERTECAGCHGIIDSIGFGLENYGAAGEWRTTEPGNASCSIEGEGELTGVGEFAGAGALGDLLVETGALESCWVRSYYQFAIGRRVDDGDDAMIDELAVRFEDDDDVLALVLQYVGSEGFRHRRLPAAP